MNKTSVWILASLFLIGIILTFCGVKEANKEISDPYGFVWGNTTTFEYSDNFTSASENISLTWSKSDNETTIIRYKRDNYTFSDNITGITYTHAFGKKCDCSKCVPRYSVIIMNVVTPECWESIPWCDEDCHCPPSFISIYCNCERDE